MKKHMRKARIKAGFTLKELGEKSLVSPSTISNWERGACVPSLDAAIMVCDAMGISLNEYTGHKAKGN